MKKLYPNSSSAVFKLCIALLITSVAIIYGCKKERSANKEVSSTPANISDAKTWFEKAYPAVGSGQANHTNSTGTGADLSQRIKPDWQHTANYARLGKDVIEMPIDPDSKFGSILKKKVNNHTYGKSYTRSSFLLLKGEKGYEAFIMTIVADSSYIKDDPAKLANNTYQHHDDDFSGLVLYFTPKGKYVNGYAYKNGQVVLPSSQTQSSGKNKVQLVQICIDWYWEVTVDGEVISSTYLYTTCTGGDTEPGGGTPPPPDPCQPGSPQPPTLPTAPGAPVAPTAIPGGHKSVNNVPGGGFLPPIDDGDGPCGNQPPSPTPHPIFGINNSNAVVPDANFNAMLDYLKGLGYSIYSPYADFVNVNGVFYHGMVTVIARADGKDTEAYFKPDADGGTMTTDFNYSMGDKGPFGTNVPSNSLSWRISMPSYFGNSNIIYTPPPAVIYNGNGSSYVDPATATTVTYTAVISAFTNFPQIIDQIESGEPVTGGPQIIMSKIGVLTSLDCLREVEVLTYQHPDWTKAQIYGTAFWNVLGGKVHFLLDVAGFVPVIGDAADLINGGIYFIEGDKINCALSVAAAIPVVGWASTAGKWVKVSIKTVPIANAAGKVAYKAIKVGRELRLIKMAVNVFDHAALITLKAIKPADKTLTNISGYLIDRFGLRIAPTESTLKNLVDDIVQLGDATGAKTEQLADALLQRNGFVKYESKIGSNNGFDGVYIKGGLTNPTEIIINEAKQIGSIGNIKLTPGNASTLLAAQMSNKWIDQTIVKMRADGNSVIKNLGNVLAVNRTKIAKTVTAVDKSTKEIVVLKLDNYGL